MLQFHDCSVFHFLSVESLPILSIKNFLEILEIEKTSVMRQF